MRSTWNKEPNKFQAKWSATLCIIATFIATFLLGWLFSGSSQNPIWSNLAYSDGLDKPWTLFTYPFATPFNGVLWLAFGCWIIHSYASDLERRLGPWGITLLFFAVTLLGGIGYAVGSAIAGQPSAHQPDFFLPLQLIIFTWAVINWSGSISLFGMIPMSCKVLAGISAASVVVLYGWKVPIVGVFTGLPLVFSWFYAKNQIPFMQFGNVPSVSEAKQKKKDDKEFHSYMDKVREKEQDRKEKERLRKMLESSLNDDDDDEKN